MVSSDIDILVVYGDERPHEKASEKTPRVPGIDRTGSLQETFADPTKCEYDAKRVGRVSRDNTKAKELILEEDLAKNVSLSLHKSFCLNRESKKEGLRNQAKRLQEQRE